MAEQNQKLNDTASSSDNSSAVMSPVSEAAAVTLEPVSTVCFDPMTTAFAFGTDGGAVKYFPAESRKGIDVACSSFGITCLVISRKGDYIAYASIDKRAAVRRTDDVEDRPVLEIKCESPVSQLIFDAAGQYIAVQCEEGLDIWSLSTKTLVSRRPNTHGLRYWISHPSQEETFVSISTVDIQCCGVSELATAQLWTMSTTWPQEVVPIEEEISALHLSSVNQKSESNNSYPSVDRVFLSPRQHHMLIQSSNLGTAKGQLDSQFTLLDTKFLSLTDNVPSSKQLVSTRLLPRTVLQRISLPLGFVFEGVEMMRGLRDPAITAAASLDGRESCSLAFIDRGFWVRSWSLDDPDGHCKKHFFLPQDWINMECLVLSFVTPDGRFFCPRNGEVAVLHNGLTLEGIEQV
jgi:WD40 repeat protein